MIMDLIKDPEDEYWQLYLQLKEICEYVCAPKITTKQRSYLKSCIEAYLCNVKELLPDCLIPKQHYLSHFPTLITIFGPLIRLFTLRFESRHVFFKNVAKQCKSFRNITLTLAHKYQYRFAYDHLYGFLSPPVVFHSAPEDVHLTNLQSSISCELPQCPQANQVQTVHDITLKNTYYKHNMWLLIAKADKIDLEVGRIVNILIYPDKSIYFLVETQVAQSSGNGYYILQKNGTGMKIMKSDQLPDYYPLTAYMEKSTGNLGSSPKHSPVFL